MNHVVAGSTALQIHEKVSVDESAAESQNQALGGPASDGQKQQPSLMLCHGQTIVSLMCSPEC